MQRVTDTQTDRHTNGCDHYTFRLSYPHLNEIEKTSSSTAEKKQAGIINYK